MDDSTRQEILELLMLDYSFWKGKKAFFLKILTFSLIWKGRRSRDRSDASTCSVASSAANGSRRSRSSRRSPRPSARFPSIARLASPTPLASSASVPCVLRCGTHVTDGSRRTDTAQKNVDASQLAES